MKNLTELLQKLSTIRFTSVLSGTEISSDDGFSLSYSTRFESHNIDKYPVQIVINIRKNGHSVQTWGCCDNEENALFVKFFNPLWGNAQQISFDRELDIKKSYKSEFENL